MMHPADHIESAEFISWDRFFTSLLTEKTKGTVAKYSKKKINEYYLSDGNITKIINKIQG